MTRSETVAVPKRVKGTDPDSGVSEKFSPFNARYVMGPFLRKTSLLCCALTLSLVVYSCGGGDGDGGTEPPTTGTVNVTVTADGSNRAGVTVQRFAPGSQTLAGAVNTSNNGVASFQNVPAGDWEFEIVMPTGFELDAGETERKSVSVTAGATAALTFRIVDAFNGETINATGGLTFNPSSLTISAGTQVRWVNTSTVLHTVTPDGHSEWSAANLSNNGSTFIHTFDTPGTYAYFCEPHVGSGMTGTITVN